MAIATRQFCFAPMLAAIVWTCCAPPAKSNPPSDRELKEQATAGIQKQLETHLPRLPDNNVLSVRECTQRT